jgi:hypothetical protein
MSALPKPESTVDARLVVQFDGAQIFDAREQILITFDAKPKHGVAGQLQNKSFMRHKNGIWSRRTSPDAIFSAQAILNAAYRRAEP